MSSPAVILIVLILLVLVLDFIMRRRRVSSLEIKTFEGVSVFLLIVYLLILTNNFTVLAVVGTTFLSLAWAFRETLANVSSTLIMYIYPQFEKNDILRIKDEADLRYQRLGFLRTKMIKPNGYIVYVPNNVLLNDLVVIK